MFSVLIWPAKAVNVNIVGVVQNVVRFNPLLQILAHLLVLLVLIWDVEDILKNDLSKKTYIDHLMTVLAVVLDLKVPWFSKTKNVLGLLWFMIQDNHLEICTFLICTSDWSRLPAKDLVQLEEETRLYKTWSGGRHWKILFVVRMTGLKLNTRWATSNFVLEQVFTWVVSALFIEGCLGQDISIRVIRTGSELHGRIKDASFSTVAIRPVDKQEIHSNQVGSIDVFLYESLRWGPSRW